MQKFLEHRIILFAALLLALTFVVIDFTRPALPIDETRYLTVAWEFVSRGEWILPTLNYEPYHHKPPMLFWLIGSMWEIFGTHVWAARLVPYFAAIGALFMTGSIARRLFPKIQMVRPLSVLLLMGGLPFVIFAPVIMFDWLLTCAVLVGVYGLICAAQTGLARYWLLFGVAMGAGVLIKGPVILLHLLLPALLLPWWKEKTWPFFIRDWLSGVVLGIFSAAAIGLAWATPAAIIGGADYARMIFFGQTTGRMVQAFDHARPFWWFLMWLPAFMVPWIFWPRAWEAVRSIKGLWKVWQYRFLILWAAPIFVMFSLISGKQLHYLFPILPAAFIFLSAVLLQNNIDASRIIRVAGRFVMVGAAVNILFHIGASQHLHKYYELNSVAAILEKAEDEGRPLAISMKYHGEIGYLAKIHKNIVQLSSHDEGLAWLRKNPIGIVITRHRNPEDVVGFHILFEKPYRSRDARFALLEKPKK